MTFPYFVNQENQIIFKNNYGNPQPITKIEPKIAFAKEGTC